MFSVNIEGRIGNCFLQIFHSSQLIVACFILLIADNILNRLGKLRYIALLHKFTDLHRFFQCFVVGSTRENNDCLTLGFRHQAQLRFLNCIRSNCEEAKLHASGDSTSGHAVHHLVKIEVIDTMTELLGLIDIRIDHLSNLLHNGSGIHDRVVDILLNILLHICQEVIGLAGSADVVLAHEPVQGILYLFTENNLVSPDIIGHEDDNVINIGGNIVHIADQIQELQNIHIHAFNACANVSSFLAALNHTTD